MIFQALLESAARNELILVDHGMLRYHLRKDGQITIHEIIVTHPNRGIGRRLLEDLKFRHPYPYATSIFAKCPADLDANGWYRHMGFVYEGMEKTRSGSWVKLWRLPLK